MKLSCSWIDPVALRELLEDLAAPETSGAWHDLLAPGSSGPGPARPAPRMAHPSPARVDRDVERAGVKADAAGEMAEPTASVEPVGAPEPMEPARHLEPVTTGEIAYDRRRTSAEPERAGVSGLEVVDAESLGVSGPPSAPEEPVHGDVSLRPYEPVAGETLVRARHLVGWVVSIESIEQSFVCDSDGLVVAQNDADAELVASSSWLITSWERVERHLRPSGFGVSSVELENGRWLVLVPGRATWGKVYLGLVSVRPLSLAMITELRRAFDLTLKES